jgi:hypothetical protein
MKPQRGGNVNIGNLNLDANGSLIPQSANTVVHQTDFTGHPTVTASMKLLAANAARVKAVIVNYGATNVVYINYGAAASATAFVHMLLPNGGTLVEKEWKGDIYGFSTTTTVAATELAP